MRLHFSIIFFLASFREKALRFYCSNFLSKCCIMGTLLFISHYSTAQNVIKVKKEEVKQEEKVVGFYYSDYHTVSSGTPGNPPSDYRRIFMYIDLNNQVYLFHSNKSVKKIYQLFMKSPDKFTQEKGHIDFADGWVYVNTKTAKGSLVSFKYVGEEINSESFYIDYKAAEYSKVSLKIYFYKYAK